MDANLDASAAFTFQEEGGAKVSLIHNDAGNWTGGEVGSGSLVGSKYGVSAPQLIAWLGKNARVTSATMAGLSLDTATAIFAAAYWNAVQGNTLPAGVDLMVVDLQYNAGSASAKILQRLAGLTGGDVDGWIGPQTIAALGRAEVLKLTRGLSKAAAQAVQTALGLTADGIVGPRTLTAAIRPEARNAVLCAALYDAHAAYYRGLSQFFLYGNGWLARTSRRLSAGMALVRPA